MTARTLQRAGVRAFAVACLAEGIALRKAGIRGTILILGYTSPEEAPLLTRWHLTQTVADNDHGRALAARGRRVHVHLALDTGMHRLGILAERVDSLEHRADEAALSEAINRILGNEYQLFHGDDELYDHLVVMRLKPTQKF